MARSNYSSGFPSPLVAIEMWQTGVQLMMLGVETQAVIALRLMGMVGIWGTASGENRRMVAEKPPAFARSANAAMNAAIQGKRPDEVMSAAVKPLRKRTKSNVTRLARKGPRRPGV